MFYTIKLNIKVCKQSLKNCYIGIITVGRKRGRETEEEKEEGRTTKSVSLMQQQE
jgi:hypothetical protein